MNHTSSISLQARTLNHTALIITLGALSAFAPFATDMYLASFPSIATSLNCSISQVQYSIATFFLGLTLGQLLYAPLIDRFGRRLPLLIGILIFSVSSLSAIFAPNISTFVVLRLLQALGGCAGMIVSRAIIQDLFDVHEAAKALTLMMMIQGIGPIAAPILGGYLQKFLGWESIFVFLTIFGFLCFMTSLKTVPETLENPRSIKLKNTLATFAQLLRNRAFTVPLLSGSLALSTMFVFISASPFVFMTLFNLSKEQYSWLFGAYALGMVVTGQLNRFFLRHYSPATIFRATLVVLVAAGMCLVFVCQTQNLPLFMTPLFVCIATVPVVGANSTALAMAAGKKDTGSASSLVGVVQFAFASLVSALVGFLHNGTAYPMTLMILLVSVLAMVLFIGVSSKARTVS